MDCIRSLGGWEQILPTLLDSVSSLSGLSGFAYSAVIGSGIKLVSSLAFLLKDIKAKKALKEIVAYKNSKILACTYFSIQNTACTYRRALEVSRDEASIRDIIEQRYQNQDTVIYDQYFYLLERISDFEQVFIDVASIGSAITLDLTLIVKYFDAKRSILARSWILKTLEGHLKMMTTLPMRISADRPG